ncbi:hypothetical protein SVIOM74S_09754 [Streptomyces violarus]
MTATAVSGVTGNHPAPVHAEDDDFVQAEGETSTG